MFAPGCVRNAAAKLVLVTTNATTHRQDHFGALVFLASRWGGGKGLGKLAVSQGTCGGGDARELKDLVQRKESAESEEKLPVDSSELRLAEGASTAVPLVRVPPGQQDRRANGTGARRPGFLPQMCLEANGKNFPLRARRLNTICGGQLRRAVVLSPCALPGSAVPTTCCEFRRATPETLTKTLPFPTLSRRGSHTLPRGSRTSSLSNLGSKPAADNATSRQSRHRSTWM